MSTKTQSSWATSSKSLASAYDAHADISPASRPQASSGRPAQSFREHTTAAAPHTSRGAPTSDLANASFGAFLAQAGPPELLSASKGSSSSIPAPVDGADVLAFLNGSSTGASFHDAIDGSFPTASTSKAPVRVPNDPVLRSDGRLARSKASPGASSPGRLSPTSTALLASVSSLDVAQRLYLSSLLAQPEDSALPRYLDMGTYADDVWAPDEEAHLPQEVNQALDAARSGREAALRRLNMLRSHLGAAITDTSSGRMDRESGTTSAARKAADEQASQNQARAAEASSSATAQSDTSANASMTATRATQQHSFQHVPHPRGYHAMALSGAMHPLERDQPAFAPAYSPRDPVQPAQVDRDATPNAPPPPPQKADDKPQRPTLEREPSFQEFLDERLRKMREASFATTTTT